MDIDKNIAGPLISNGPVLKLINFSNFNISSDIFILKEKISDGNKSNVNKINSIVFIPLNIKINNTNPIIFSIKKTANINYPRLTLPSSKIHNIGKKINQINIFNLNFYISETIGVKINFISKGMLIKKFDEIKSEDTNDLKNYIFRDNRYKLIIKHREINEIIFPKERITYDYKSNSDKINSIAFIASNIIHNIGKKINQINIFNLNFYISKTIGVKINFISKGMLIKKFDEIKSEETNDLKNYIFRDNRYKLIIKHRKINKIIYPKTHITYYNKPTKRI